MSKKPLDYFWLLILCLYFLTLASEHAGQGGWLAILLPGTLLFLAFKVMADCFPLLGKIIRQTGSWLGDVLFFCWRTKKNERISRARSIQPEIRFRR